MSKIDPSGALDFRVVVGVHVPVAHDRVRVRPVDRAVGIARLGVVEWAAVAERRNRHRRERSPRHRLGEREPPCGGCSSKQNASTDRRACGS